MPTHLTNCHLLTSIGIQADSSLRIADGLIDRIGAAAVPGDAVIDCGGGLLVPGLIDLHCDALEGLLQSRPGVHMPLQHVMPAADSLYASAGVTTIHHAVAFADDDLGVRSLDTAASIAHDIHDWRQHGVIDHRLHTRYEISDVDGVDVISRLLEQDMVGLVSVMDHAPGQGQFQSMDSFISFQARTYKLSEDEARDLAERKMNGAVTGWDRAAVLMQRAVDAGIPVASHDDDSPEKVAKVAALGATISEFPLDLDTLQAAQAAGLATVLGSPNIVRGGSQSGNMRALDGVLAGTLDCLCADYVPWTLVAAACSLPAQSELDLVAAFDLVSRNPARTIGLDDRGRISPGLRADLALIAQVRDLPQVITTWCEGRVAYRSDPPQAAPFPLDPVATSA